MSSHIMRGSLLALSGAVLFIGSTSKGDTIAYWNFENAQKFSDGSPVTVTDGLVLEAAQTGTFPAGPFTPNPNLQVVSDASGNNNTLRSFHNATSGNFTSSVPYAVVPGTGAANNFAWNVPSRAPTHDAYETNTGNLRTAMNASPRWSVETSFNQSSQVGFQGIVGRDRATGDSGTLPLAAMWLGVSAGDNPDPNSNTHVGRLHFYTWNPTGGISITDMGQTGNTYFGVGDPILINQWYSVAVTGDGTNMRLYMKSPGDSSYRFVYKFVQSGLGTQTGGWTVGRGQFNGAPADGFEGKLDDVRISNARLYPSEFLATANWATNVDGNWSDGAKWTGGLAPGGTSAAAQLGGVANSTRIVNLDVDVNLDSLGFAGGDYTINGTKTITLNGDLRFINSKGNAHAVVNAPVALNGELNFDNLVGSSVRLATFVDAPTRGIHKFGQGAAAIDSVNVNTLELVTGDLALSGSFANGASAVQFLDLASPNGRLDLQQAGLVLNHDGSFTYESILGVIGTQIVSTTATSAMAIGLVENSMLGKTTFGGRSANPDALILRTVFKGDSNLSGKVDFDDLLALAQNYDAAGSGKKWIQGDFDYSGVVNFDDLLSLAQNYNQSILTDGQSAALAALGSDFASDWKLAQSLVPEPASLSLLALPLLAGRRRR